MNAESINNKQLSLSNCEVERIFNQEFASNSVVCDTSQGGRDFTTQLVGGFDEPVYVPSSDKSTLSKAPTEAKICYRENFVSSALHEVSHWSIAGAHRRTLEDFGYWYVPDGRNLAQQRAFFQVEVKPQALECLFSIAIGISFKPSVDNLDAEPSEQSDTMKETNEFCVSVYRHAKKLLESFCAINNRAEIDEPVDLPFFPTDAYRFIKALLQYRSVSIEEFVQACNQFFWQELTVIDSLSSGEKEGQVNS